MRKFKEQKGAITVLVIATVLFITMFLVTAYWILSNKLKTQQETVNQMKMLYETDVSMESIYDSYFAKGEIIPIYSYEQLKQIGSEKQISITEEKGKIYTFSKDGVYVLMADIKTSEEWYPNMLGENLEEEENEEEDEVEFSGLLETNGHKIIADGIEYPYTWIEENLKEREILTANQKVKEENLIKIAKAMHDSGLSLNCFTIYNELQENGKVEVAAYLYGPIYDETFIEGDGEASYAARVEKFDILNEITDGMLFGDLNENGKVEQEDNDLIEGYYNMVYDMLPKAENVIYDEEWLSYYYVIIGDVNEDYSLDVNDSSDMNLMLNNLVGAGNFVREYDYVNYDWYEQELILFNY